MNRITAFAALFVAGAMPVAPFSQAAAAQEREADELAPLRQEASELARARTIIARAAVAQDPALLTVMEADLERSDAAFERRLLQELDRPVTDPTREAAMARMSDLVAIAEQAWGLTDARLGRVYRTALNLALRAGSDLASLAWADRAMAFDGGIDTAVQVQDTAVLLDAIEQEIAIYQQALSDPSTSTLEAYEGLEGAARRAVAITALSTDLAKQHGSRLVFLGELLVRDGRVETGLPMIEQGTALLASRGGDREGLTLLARRSLGHGYLAAERPADAIGEFRRACAVSAVDIHARPDGAPDAVSRIDCDTGPATALWQLAASSLDDASQLAEAFEWAQAGHNSAAASRALAHQRSAALAATSGLDAVRRAFDAALDRREQIEARLNDANGADTSGILSDYLSNRRELSDLGERLQAALPLYFDYRMPAVVPLAALQDATATGEHLLGENEALILWMEGAEGNQGLVFAVSRERRAWATIPMTSDELTQTIAELRGQITSGFDGFFDRSLAYELWQNLLGDPAIREVTDASRIDTVLIVATGPLATLPPGLLVTAPPSGEDDDLDALRRTPWLIRQKAIAVLPSVSALRTLRELLPAARPESADVPLIAFANPDYGGHDVIPGLAPGDDPFVTTIDATLVMPPASPPPGPPTRQGQLRLLRALPHTLKEGVTLARLLAADPANIMFGPAATEAELWRLDESGTLERARVLAFSTHGFLSGELSTLEEPALAFATPANALVSDGADGFLTASEAATLRLNADLVLLSACNTAGGDRHGGEALSGLARAFFHAGARSLVVSHWLVDDEATSRLVSGFAAQLAHPDSNRAMALQAAILAMIDGEEGSSVYADPYYWAPLTFVGVP